ncbi:hypothetical protein GCM10009777_04900 [Microbacterium pumilum]|uniref:Uncharacterized protein n=2 Tax=Microbacterium pumilum TaxID=344165 RepID=A0ABN2RUH3_9MICO
MYIRLRTAIVIGTLAALIGGGMASISASAVRLTDLPNLPPAPTDLPSAPVAPAAPAVGAAAVGAVTTSELDFVPVAPCRVVDTRAAGGKFASGASRALFVGGTVGFLGQGGTGNGCGVPLAAKAVALSITTGEATGAGRIVAWADGASQPNSTALSYLSSGSMTGNPIVPLSTTGKIRLLNVKAATHLVIDVAGYYIAPMVATIGSNGSIQSSSGRVLSVNHAGTGAYFVSFDRPLTGCAATAQVSAYAFAEGVTSRTRVDGSLIDVRLDNISHNPTDRDFTLMILC